MMHDWPAQGLTLRHFAMSEFKYPQFMDREFMICLDELRHLVGEPLTVTSDGRLDSDMRRIYGSETWPDSPHWMKGGRPCVAADLVPEMKNQSAQYYDDVRAAMIYHGLSFRFSVTGCGPSMPWPRQGLEIATAHIHVDMSLTLRRPHLWTGRSR